MSVEQKRGAWRNGPMKSLLARPIAFHPALARICGSVNAGLMLSQALYWSERTSDGSGWFYKTYDEWTEELYLTRHELDGARRILRDKGFVREDKRGMPAKTYYFVELDAVCEAIEQLSDNQQSRSPKSGEQDNRKAASSETGDQRGRKPAAKAAEKQQSFLSETETTAESTAETHHAVSGALKMWLAMKTELETRLPADEWDLWVRPARLLKVMSGTVLLIALPPSNAIVTAAKARRDLLRELAAAAGFGDVVFTPYPDEHTRERLKREYPDFYEQMVGNRDRASVRQ